MQTRISIAGDIGSGKSTIARAVAQRMEVAPLSTGGIQRQLAAARGINTLELNRLAETDPAIDKEIDDYLRALPAGPLVVESRMAWHFVPGTCRVFLYILPAAAAQRILGASRSDESYRHIEEAITLLNERRESEVRRFQKYYGVDIGDLRNYDLVIDTTHAGIERVVAAIVGAEATGTTPPALLAPVDLLPTRGIDNVDEARLGELGKSIAAHGFDHVSPIDVLYVDHAFFIAEGHVRTAAAFRAGLDLVPCRIAACADEPYGLYPSAREAVQAARPGTLVDGWQAAVGFRYKYSLGA